MIMFVVFYQRNRRGKGNSISNEIICERRKLKNSSKLLSCFGSVCTDEFHPEGGERCYAPNSPIVFPCFAIKLIWEIIEIISCLSSGFSENKFQTDLDPAVLTAEGENDFSTNANSLLLEGQKSQLKS